MMTETRQSRALERLRVLLDESGLLNGGSYWSRKVQLALHALDGLPAHQLGWVAQLVEALLAVVAASQPSATRDGVVRDFVRAFHCLVEAQLADSPEMKPPA